MDTSSTTCFYIYVNYESSDFTSVIYFRCITDVFLRKYLEYVSLGYVPSYEADIKKTAKMIWNLTVKIIQLLLMKHITVLDEVDFIIFFHLILSAPLNANVMGKVHILIHTNLLKVRLLNRGATKFHSSIIKSVFNKPIFKNKDFITIYINAKTICKLFQFFSELLANCRLHNCTLSD